ncbi:MAG: NAD-dependent epimerase/dehydratase family protein [Selenomonadaceae bacterium]|nr:NAD-dependent epimerase/dehydratase family protein [Selenomonadaceae bacterium]
MKILVTGAGGFIGKNLIASLKTFGHEVFEYHHAAGLAALEKFCRDCEFVFHLAGVNRPETVEEFAAGNKHFTAELVNFLERADNFCPIAFASSIQVELNNPYGQSKLAAEKILLAHGEKTSARILIYRLPNVFGKWCRPNYNSAIATFCFNAARGLPLKVNDPAREMHLVYIDDVVKEFIRVLDGEETQEIPSFKKNLRELAELIQSFSTTRATLSIPDQRDDLTSKLFSTYQSYLPEENFSYELKMHKDERGSFSEFVRTDGQGQFSANVIKPHVTKGNHWHHSKHEKFLVVAGEGVIRFRQIFSDKIFEYKVSGERHEVVDIPPGCTHSIENIGETDMTVFIWANENFNPAAPDTYFLKVNDTPSQVDGGGDYNYRLKKFLLIAILIVQVVKGGEHL